MAHENYHELLVLLNIKGVIEEKYQNIHSSCIQNHLSGRLDKWGLLALWMLSEA